MIHLDTNFLIMALIPDTAQERQLRGWLAAGEAVGVDAVVWSEFLCGPLTDEQRRVAQALFASVASFTGEDGARAAELFNASGRRRGSLTDCMIAGVCLRTGAPLATANVGDFRPFEGLGLRIIPF